MVIYNQSIGHISISLGDVEKLAEMIADGRHDEAIDFLNKESRGEAFNPAVLKSLAEMRKRGK